MAETTILPPPAQVISTGSLRLDFALGVGGVPRGQFIEIYGPDSSGKTTLCLHIIAEAQKSGGICALIDTEHTLEPSYAARCGVQVDSLYISEPETAEEALEILEILAGSGSMDVVVVDSVTALTSRAELAASLGEATPASSDSLLSLTLQKLSAPLRRSNTTVIFTNQIRPGKNVVYHQLAANPSRLALKLHATLRLELRVIQPIKNNNQIIGDRIRVRVVKNQFAPCIQSAELDIIYNVGMIKTGEILDLGTQLSVVDIKGMVYSFRGMLLGVGRQSAINFLDLNRPVVQEIEQIVRQKLLLQ